MATIKKAMKKACKGVSYPKSSSVSSRLGSPSKAKKGTKIKKAQDGENIPPFAPAPMYQPFGKRKSAQEAKSKYNASTSPKVEYTTKGFKVPEQTTPSKRVSIDTQGLSSGARRFPVKTTGPEGDRYYPIRRRQVNKALSNQKMGGKTKKAAKGGSFPDLNKDGKITKKDVLIGRGVLPKTAKKGKAIPKGMHKMPGGKLMKNSMMKKGGKMTKKCAYGCK